MGSVKYCYCRGVFIFLVVALISKYGVPFLYYRVLIYENSNPSLLVFLLRGHSERGHFKPSVNQ